MITSGDRASGPFRTRSRDFSVSIKETINLERRRSPYVVSPDGSHWSAQIRAHHSHPALYTMGMGQPFQTQNLRYNGVVFIAEVKVRDVLSRLGRLHLYSPRYSDDRSRRLAGRGGHRGASSNNAQSHKRNSHSQKGNRKFREKAPAENYVVKRIAGAERSTSSEAVSLLLPDSHHNSPSLQGYLFRHALNVLSSFDLILLGDWEADPIQRRALLSLILGPKQVNQSDSRAT